MVQCTNCQETLKEESKFCHQCGTKVILNERCECGNILEKTDHFCSQCGKAKKKKTLKSIQKKAKDVIVDERKEVKITSYDEVKELRGLVNALSVVSKKEEKLLAYNRIEKILEFWLSALNDKFILVMHSLDFLFFEVNPSFKLVKEEIERTLSWGDNTLITFSKDSDSLYIDCRINEKNQKEKLEYIYTFSFMEIEYYKKFKEQSKGLENNSEELSRILWNLTTQAEEEGKLRYICHVLMPYREFINLLQSPSDDDD
ncbi:zinc ribbon domain-containing protein [Lysinibacillus antri]|uniref:Zinc ribbon domain-containing protein n=1 Tax=Lysinibacillus antri TaxID=2498145 RepID=A0A432LFC4_9BACI|nr:zinc ribbon domain-containing protein [Lysinibacillus antri]RUL55950.1 zinc ribbon domain-containing protein [Lysinibacillus antri]